MASHPTTTVTRTLTSSVEFVLFYVSLIVSSERPSNASNSLSVINISTGVTYSTLVQQTIRPTALHPKIISTLCLGATQQPCNHLQGYNTGKPSQQPQQMTAGLPKHAEAVATDSVVSYLPNFFFLRCFEK